MTSPADELRAAATFVRSVAEANTAISENRPLPPEVQGQTRADVARADMHPAVGRALADWLDGEAKRITCASSTAGQEIVGRRALAVARQINGGERQ